MSLFGLSTHDRKTLATIPPPLAQPVVLENRLMELHSIRSETFRRMRARTNTLVQRAKYQAELVAVNTEINATVLRLRTKALLP